MTILPFLILVVGTPSMKAHPTQKRNSTNILRIKNSSSNEFMEEKKYSYTLNVSAERTSQNKDSYQNPSVGEDQGTRVESPALDANYMRHSSGSSSPQLVNDSKPASGLKQAKSAKIINISTKVPKEHFRKGTF